ncbi:MAG: Unknown protein [uncultured Sulfurovum sp.]|uniref:Lipoprotein n=1 Tax=uncultured Sulfurovum sp. TaxID=269237 RepID=A0A6S6SI99_9BACT|nr:MAG: Unknown protein [uncultured Sulfurovum sp.]
MKKIWIASAIATAMIMTGCGSSSSSNEETTAIDLPDGKTLIFFDNASSAQYLYNTDTETASSMNIAGENYDMTGKNGQLVMWNHETDAGVDQKIVMVDEYFDITNGSFTYEDMHYLGHFHEENSVPVFAAHSADEFDPAVSSDGQKAALVSFNAHLTEQNEIKNEIAEALPSGETLCNFFVFEHEDHDDGEEEEATPHIALTTTGKMYIFEENEEGLVASQSTFLLDGVSQCSQNQSGIIKNDDYGVLVFSAQSQKIYLVDSHGEDFHVHSTWDTDRFLPAGFTPTTFTGIGESDEYHDH